MAGRVTLKDDKAPAFFACGGARLGVAKVQFIIRLTTSPQLAQKRHHSQRPRSAYYESKAFNGEM